MALKENNINSNSNINIDMTTTNGKWNVIDPKNKLYECIDLGWMQSNNCRDIIRILPMQINELKETSTTVHNYHEYYNKNNNNNQNNINHNHNYNHNYNHNNSNNNNNNNNNSNNNSNSNNNNSNSNNNNNNNNNTLNLIRHYQQQEMHTINSSTLYRATINNTPSSIVSSSSPHTHTKVSNVRKRPFQQMTFSDYPPNSALVLAHENLVIPSPKKIRLNNECVASIIILQQGINTRETVPKLMPIESPFVQRQNAVVLNVEESLPPSNLCILGASSQPQPIVNSGYNNDIPHSNIPVSGRPELIDEKLIANKDDAWAAQLLEQMRAQQHPFICRKTEENKYKNWLINLEQTMPVKMDNNTSNFSANCTMPESIPTAAMPILRCNDGLSLPSRNSWTFSQSGLNKEKDSVRDGHGHKPKQPKLARPRSRARNELVFVRYYRDDDPLNLRNMNYESLQISYSKNARGFQRGGPRTKNTDPLVVSNFKMKPPDDNLAYSRIRVWKDEAGRHFYDCICNVRKPVQDLNKIKKHALSHEQGKFLCDICGKIFTNNHLQLNAHKKTHVREKI